MNDRTAGAAAPAMKTADYYTALDSGAVLCRLCPHGCRVLPGGHGFCGVRGNRDGVLYAESYGVIASCGLDPMEKKPLYHFFPGSRILSFGSFGCNFRCAFCQNHTIAMAMAGPEPQRTTPEQAAALSRQLIPDGNIGAAYTYNEPLVGYEFVKDCAALIHAQGQQNVLVTNGYISPEPLAALLPYIDALNIDLKSFSADFYRRVKGNVETVKQTIAAAAKQAHVEATTLVIPGENDSEDEMDALARFLAGINPEMPLHLSRFFPRHQMTDKPPTPEETLYRLKAVAARHLRYVYLGNMPSKPTTYNFP